jgi:cytoskeletal protein CcmA (bactofilin family)
VDPSLILEKTSTPRNQIQPVLKPVILPVSSEEFSVFGIGFTLTGDVSSESSLIIKGKVIGNIVSTQRIIIESGAEVIGNVTAQDLRICGSVNGIITVHQKLSIEHSAKVVGSIHTTTLSVEKGAVLDCQISDH